jgi:UDP-N-acetylmuramoylalanine--D-glutamate ligase
VVVRAAAAYGDSPLRLILGGSSKGEDFTAYARELPGTVQSIYLIGESAVDLARALDAADRAYEHAGDLQTAVARAAAAAEPGDVVLLSPASASYDQFNDFEHRGNEFRRIVEELA